MIFSAPMVRALLSGAKSQTRRMISFHNSICAPRLTQKQWDRLDWKRAFVDLGPSQAGNPGPYLLVLSGNETWIRIYPRIWNGDLIYVKETWLRRRDMPTLFRADCPMDDTAWQWKSPLFLRKKHARIWRRVARVRAERRNEISYADALAEGVDDSYLVQHRLSSDRIAGYRFLVESIHGNGAWDKNPLVWVYELRPTGDASTSSA